MRDGGNRTHTPLLICSGINASSLTFFKYDFWVFFCARIYSHGAQLVNTQLEITRAYTPN